MDDRSGNIPAENPPTNDAVARLQTLLSATQRQKQALRDLVVTLIGAPPPEADTSAYLEWVVDCALFFHDHQDPISMVMIIQTLTENHPLLADLGNGQGYPAAINAAYVGGRAVVARTLRDLSPL